MRSIGSRGRDSRPWLDPVSWSVANLLSSRKDVRRDRTVLDVPPLHIESASITKQRPPDAIPDVDTDAKASSLVVVPFPNVRDSAEQHREAEADDALVEPLRSGTESEPALDIHGQVNVDGKVFMRAEGSNFRADVELPSGNARWPVVSPSPVTSKPKAIRVV